MFKQNVYDLKMVMMAEIPKFYFSSHWKKSKNCRWNLKLFILISAFRQIYIQIVWFSTNKEHVLFLFIERFLPTSSHWGVQAVSSWLWGSERAWEIYRNFLPLSLSQKKSDFRFCFLAAMKNLLLLSLFAWAFCGSVCFVRAWW